MGKIQDKNIFYELIKWYAGKIFRSTYRKTEIRGLENIPENAAIIYAPNHTSGMTDALSMIFMDGKRKVFVARADIFRNPHVAKILYFFKLMPINRMRDGIRNMKNNGDTFEKAVDVLRDGVPFVIFPEGTHRYEHSLITPLQKGIFRIALKAEKDPDVKSPVCIMPVGIEYSNYFRFFGTQAITVGKPIYISGYMEKYPETDTNSLMNIMRDDLEKEMKKLIFHVPFDENYNSLIDCSRILAAMRKNRRATGCGSFSNRKNAESTIAERIAEDNAAAASIMQAPAFPEIMETGNLVHDERTAKKIRICSIIRRPGRANIAMRSFSAVLLLPFAIAWSIPSMPIAIADLLAERLLKDKAFINTFRFIGFAVAWPVLFIAYAVILFSGMSWQPAALACAIILPAPYCIYRYGRLVSILLSDIRFRRNKRLPMLLEKLEKYFSGIL